MNKNEQLQDTSIFQGILEANGVRYEYRGGEVWAVSELTPDALGGNSWLFAGHIRAPRRAHVAALAWAWGIVCEGAES